MTKMLTGSTLDLLHITAKWVHYFELDMQESSMAMLKVTCKSGDLK